MMAYAPLVWALAATDLRLFLADRRGALLCFAVPILLASAFGAVFDRPGATDAVRLPLFVVIEDDSPLTHRVAEGLRKASQLDASLVDRATALGKLTDSGVAVIFPAGFGAGVTRGDRPAVQLLHHPGSVVEAHWAEGLITEVVLRETATEVLGPLTRLRPGLCLERPFGVERAAVTGAGTLRAGGMIDSYSHSFCGMTVQYLLFWGMDSGLALLRERRRGTWRRLRAAPVPSGALLAGKALATALVALAQIACTFAFGAVVFGVRLNGSITGFVAVAVAAALLSAATGLVVAALGGTEARARSVAILVILTMALLGGLWLPSFLLPGWAQRLALVLPTTWAARGFEGVTWQGMGLAGAGRCALVLIGLSSLFLAVARWGFARSDAHLQRGAVA